MATSLAGELRYPTGASAAGRARRVAGGLSSARVRILGWFVVLIAAAIAASLVVQREVLVNRLSHRIDTRLSVEANDLLEQAQRTPSGSVRDLLETFFRTHVGDPDEELLAVVGDGGPILRNTRPYHVEDVPGFLARLGGLTTAARGVVTTPQGQARYLAVPLRQPGGPAGTFVAAYFTGPGMSEVDGEVAVAAAVSLTTLLVMSLLAWLVAGRVLAPVRAMTDTARAISDTDLTRRIPAGGDDEIGRLAATFNAMLDRLESAFASQRNFISDAGHELRTPITVVKGHLELMGDEPADRRETLALVDDELERMSRMVDDLLLLAKAERPGFLRVEAVELGELVREVLAKVAALAPRGWSAQVGSTATTMADRQRLTQAVMNLVTNAVRHTDDGDAITLSLEVSDGQYRLTVADTGTGIAPEDQARIFERFARGRADRRRSQGAGLGLAIVRAIAEAHHGRVELVSAPGRGAAFSLVVPVQPPTEERP